MGADLERGEPVALRTARKITMGALVLSLLPAVAMVFTGGVGSFVFGACVCLPLWLCSLFFVWWLHSSDPSQFARRMPRWLVWAVIGMLWGQLLAWGLVWMFGTGDQDCFQDCAEEPPAPSLFEWFLGIRSGDPWVGLVTLPGAAVGALLVTGVVLFLVAGVSAVSGWVMAGIAGKDRRSR